MKSQISHQIKHRKIANDDFTTPDKLALHCIGLVPLSDGDIVLDACRGNGAFYNQYPEYIKRCWCEIKEGKDFYQWNKSVDWIITNPPYSHLESWLLHTYDVCQKGFGYLIGLHNLTPRRIQKANQYGFSLTGLHLCKVFQWYGMTAFVIFEKNKKNIISYDRTVWR